MSILEKREIILFTSIIIALSSLICFIAYKLDDSNFAILTVFTPSLLALVFTALTKGRKGVYDLFIKQTVKRTPIKWLLLSLLGIPLIVSFAILTELNFDLSRFSLRTTQVIPQVIVIVLIALGEEYGWRGFLQRELRPMGLRPSTFVIGMIWATWHIPIISSGVHTYPPTPTGYLLAYAFFVLWGFVQSYAVLKTGSVWTAAFLHGVVNSVYSFTLTYLVRPDDKLFSFGLGAYGLVCMAGVALMILRDPIWSTPHVPETTERP